MEYDVVAEFEACLVGRSCVIGRGEHGWAFDLTGGVFLTVSCPWRIVSGGGIAFGSGDHGELFGGTSPVDGEAEAQGALDGKVITAASVDRQTADLTLQFGQETRIDLFNASLGHEGWQAGYGPRENGWSVIALGGGELSLIGIDLNEPRFATED
ncbi:hypothetical protein [Frigidibacter sp.]|uniref:hypothetical protein n=1 Tax=Frigidibacter sp. TaxID=2586418 RepID=UPI002734ADFB|nr:hypothetical protein [Frigidibacter sp.]MDP3339593.1 hypothetical protein [Frigidibacter sp.]